MYNLKDKVALVTGGANGIGASIVREFLKEEVKHIAILDIDETAGAALDKEITNIYGPGRAQFFKCDVTKDEELFVAYNKTMKSFGVIDVVVNNAGIICDSPEGYKREININFTATVSSCLKALEIMRTDKGGKGGTIINISSATAIVLSSPFLFVYAATKSAILHFSNSIGMEEYYKHTNVRVVTMCFGMTDTELVKDVKGIDKTSSDHTNAVLNAVKEHGLVQSPEDAARGVVTSYVNGETGSTWLVNVNKTYDISQNIIDGFKIMSSKLYVTNTQ